MATPVYPGAALGFRLWEIRDDSLLPAYSYMMEEEAKPWDGADARCNRGAEHPAPSADCQCGYHAYHDPRLAIGLRLRFALEHPDLEHVLAAVAGAGRLEVHQQGWRAQKLQLLGLMGSRQSVSAVAQAYSVPTFSSDRALISYAASLPGVASDIPEQRLVGLVR